MRESPFICVYLHSDRMYGTLRKHNAEDEQERYNHIAGRTRAYARVYRFRHIESLFGPGRRKNAGRTGG